MSKVIVFGSLNMDLSIESDHMPNLGETIIGRGFITNPGGKGANQAVAAAKMGAAVCMLGAVGADSFGDQMIASLAEHGVTCEYITRSESCPTGVAIITRVCGDNFITIDAGANASTRIDAVRRALDKVAEPGDVFLAQLECDYETTWAALAEACKQGLYVAINPAPAHEIPEAVLPCLDLVVVNEGECEMMTGIYPADATSARAAADKLKESGVGCVAITLGARGSMVFCGNETIESVPPKTRAIDTTCAGDTYIGAMVAGYARGLSLADSVALATKASAMATTKVGAQQSIPTLAEVE